MGYTLTSPATLLQYGLATFIFAYKEALDLVQEVLYKALNSQTTRAGIDSAG